jgi:phosphate transport system permease protein
LSSDLQAEREQFSSRMFWRRTLGVAFEGLCLSSTLVGLLVLLALLVILLEKGWGWLDWQFLTSFMSRRAERAGILSGIWSSLWLILFTALFAVPVGVGAAVYLEEYARGTRLTRLIQLNLSNLAGVPSIVYGILGLTVFVRMFGLFGPADFPTVLSGALTLGLLVLPVVIVATQEALRSVPPSLRHASLALGATQWQTIWHQVLPAAIPGIITGVILALSRAMGETAPLIVLGVPAYWAGSPGDIDAVGDIVTSPQKLLDVPFSKFTPLPMIIYTWVKESRAAFRENLSAAGILVLLAMLLALNSVAIFIRYRYQKRIRW